MKEFFNIILDLFGFGLDEYISKSEKRKLIVDKFYLFAIGLVLIIVLIYYLRKS